ncbi:MAG TPA: hypothetical protein PLL22_01680 [Microbacteriaceae bacterium]|nr:hypothetical protein [Microbacteriaceae bacterium]HQC92538.1 hypothetical protein [Microbacteriaceae bacterium]
MTRYEPLDVRPVATHGWTVTVANVDEETADVSRREYPLVGWAVCRIVYDDPRLDDGVPIVKPCWWDVEELTVGQYDDAFVVCGPGEEPDLKALTHAAIAAARREYERTVKR